MGRCCGHDGDEGKLFPPHVPEAVPLLGEKGFALFEDLCHRIYDRINDRYGPAEPVAHLLSWISKGEEGNPPREQLENLKSFDWLEDPTHGTYAPHVDQANMPEYDVSALLYLSTAGVDFEGGLFAFNDADHDRVLVPRAGRLLAFHSGFENLHQVRPVLSGERLVLSIWFSSQQATRPSV